MNNKIIFCSVALVFSGMTIASESPDKFVALARVMFNQYDMRKARETIMSNLVIHKEYRAVDTYKNDIDRLPANYKIYKRQILSDITVAEKYKCLEIIHSQGNNVVFFDFANKSQLVLKLKRYYDLYKTENNSCFCNSNNPFYIHLIDNTDMPYDNCNMHVHSAVSIELQPHQVEDILGLYDLKIWKALKGALLMGVMAVLFYNYS